MTFPIRYAADIQSPGQCRDNLKKWRGSWLLALESTPPQEDEDEDADIAAADSAVEQCRAVLTHRSKATDATETRWFGTAMQTYLCGDFAFVTVNWSQRAQGVSANEGLDASPAVEDITAAQDHPAGGGAFLLRSGYLMWGDVGNAVDTPDDCIKLSVASGYKAVE